ncbi:GGDEF domain-containing protein [Shewanella sp. JM162201]|uniref:diguanylate cyclase n=1 Tax=Shewanella jiangmenensis TaxID=2837387 RepID=A0ABS5V2P1_9GAMM|nr:GGDEF domain-containing protein [Shewanella jiangmenensis]MBT1444200.1 GGDEF domain-containing protein [Shewanella jiangmenensis]
MDAYTLHIATAFASVMMTISMLGLFIASPREYSLLNWSLAGMLFMATTGLSLATYHFDLPFWIAPAAANLCYLAGHGAMLMGVRRYFGLKTYWQLYLLFIPMLALLQTLPWMQASVTNRLLVFFPLLIVLSLVIAWQLWRHTSAGNAPELRLACLPLMLLELVFASQLALRTYIMATSEVELHLTEGGNQLLQTAGTLAVFVFASWGTIACALMVVRRQELSLQHLTTRDPLTGWFNRRVLSDIAAREFERSHRTSSALSLLIIDIDHFKKINDQYGHAVGDAALKHVTRICEQQLRGYDYLFRFGGEEFVILLPQSDELSSSHLSNRLRWKVQNSVLNHAQHEVRCTVSIGFAQRREQDESWSQIFERADAALYHAKETGRDRVAYHNGFELSAVC